MGYNCPIQEGERPYSFSESYVCGSALALIELRSSYLQKNFTGLKEKQNSTTRGKFLRVL